MYEASIRLMDEYAEINKWATYLILFSRNRTHKYYNRYGKIPMSHPQSWNNLFTHHQQNLNKIHLRDLLRDEKRNEALLVQHDNIVLDLSHEKIDVKTLELLSQLAQDTQLNQQLLSLFNGVTVVLLFRNISILLKIEQFCILPLELLWIRLCTLRKLNPFLRMCMKFLIGSKTSQRKLEMGSWEVQLASNSKILSLLELEEAISPFSLSTKLSDLIPIMCKKPKVGKSDFWPMWIQSMFPEQLKDWMWRRPWCWSTPRPSPRLRPFLMQKASRSGWLKDMLRKMWLMSVLLQSLTSVLVQQISKRLKNSVLIQTMFSDFGTLLEADSLYGVLSVSFHFLFISDMKLCRNSWEAVMQLILTCWKKPTSM